MKILSNDYKANIPTSKKKAQGGPAVFADNLSSHVCNKGYIWNGLLIVSTPTAKHTQLRKLKGRGSKSYYKLIIPNKKIKEIFNASSIFDAKLFFRKEIDRIAKLIKKLDIDVVFINGFSLFVWMLLISAKENDVPVVIQRAGIFSKELDMHKHKFSPQGIRMMKKMERESSLLADVEIFITEWSRNYYASKVYKESEKSSVVIPLPFDFYACIPQKQKKEAVSGRIKIGSVARWDRIKNHPALLRLAEEIEKQGLNWEINSVTKIPNTKIDKKFKDSYRKKIKVISPMGRSDIFNFISSMDMMILPSFFDTASYVVIESIACGTPIIISPTTGYSPIFNRLEAKEYITDFKDSVQVIKKIKKLSNKKIPKKLVSYMKKKHNPNKVFSSYLKIFKKISL